MSFESESISILPAERQLISRSREMQDLYESMPRLAHSKANILVLGESGTGKELIAKMLHDLGPRRQRKFIAINCAAVPETLLESELFGHEKGSFTGASYRRKGLIQESDGGTLFLDEIGDMPLSLQAKLLRVLQERAVRPVGGAEPKDVDFRLIAATNQDLKVAVKERQFREDLYYRLNVVPLAIPPLRKRTEDIPFLVRSFLELYSIRDGVQIPRLCPEALENLKRRRWKGNVRELENVIERMVVLNGHKGRIELEDLPVEPEEHSTATVAFKPMGKLPTVEVLVKQYIFHVLEQVDHHQGSASEILGLSRRTLYRKLKAYSQA